MNRPRLSLDDLYALRRLREGRPLPGRTMRIPGSFRAGPQYAGITALSRVRDEAALEWYTRYLRDTP